MPEGIGSGPVFDAYLLLVGMITGSAGVEHKLVTYIPTSTINVVLGECNLPRITDSQEDQTA